MFTVTIFKIDKAAYFYFIFCQIVNARWYGGQKSSIKKKQKEKKSEKAGKYRKAQKYDREYERFVYYSLLIYKAANTFTWTLEGIVVLTADRLNQTGFCQMYMISLLELALQLI